MNFGHRKMQISSAANAAEEDAAQSAPLAAAAAAPAGAPTQVGARRAPSRRRVDPFTSTVSPGSSSSWQQARRPLRESSARCATRRGSAPAIARASGPTLISRSTPRSPACARSRRAAPAASPELEHVAEHSDPRAPALVGRGRRSPRASTSGWRCSSRRSRRRRRAGRCAARASPRSSTRSSPSGGSRCARAAATAASRFASWCAWEKRGSRAPCPGCRRAPPARPRGRAAASMDLRPRPRR